MRWTIKGSVCPGCGKATVRWRHFKKNRHKCGYEFKFGDFLIIEVKKNYKTKGGK